MADADIEALLEAPYKKEAVPSKDKSDGEDSDQKSKRKHKKKHSRSSRSRSRSRSPKRRSRSPKRHSRSPRRRRSRSHSPRRRRSSPHYGGGGGGGNRRDSRGGYYRGRDDRDRGGGFRGGGANLQEASPKVSGPSESEEEPSSPGPDLTQEERDARTVLCMQLSARVTKKALKQLFQQVGKVTDVKMISDKNSRRPKGIAYVEFRELESVHKALNLNGQRIEGIPIVIQPSMAEKNRIRMILWCLAIIGVWLSYISSSESTSGAISITWWPSVSIVGFSALVLGVNQESVQILNSNRYRICISTSGCSPGDNVYDSLYAKSSQDLIRQIFSLLKPLQSILEDYAAAERRK